MSTGHHSTRRFGCPCGVEFLTVSLQQARTPQPTRGWGSPVVLATLRPLGRCSLTLGAPTYCEMVMRAAAVTPSGVLATLTLTLVPGLSIDASPATCATIGTLAGTSNSVWPMQPVPAPPGASAARPVQAGEPGAPAPWKVSLMTGVPEAL